MLCTHECDIPLVKEGPSSIFHSEMMRFCEISRTGEAVQGTRDSSHMASIQHWRVIISICPLRLLATPLIWIHSILYYWTVCFIGSCTQGVQYEALVSTSEQERGGWLNVTSSTEYIKTRQNSPAYNERNLKPGLLGCFHLLHFKDNFLKMIFDPKHSLWPVCLDLHFKDRFLRF